MPSSRTAIQRRLDKFTPLHTVLDYGVFQLFLHHPLRFVYFGLHKKLALGKGKLHEVGILTGESMNIILPASIDIYFFGLKCHPSEIALARYLTNTLQP